MAAIRAVAADGAAELLQAGANLLRAVGVRLALQQTAAAKFLQRLEMGLCLFSMAAVGAHKAGFELVRRDGARDF